jgi:two-component sensor histidine kinase
MLMRELKHRVKNNLNMVRSLISLERDSTLEGPARERLSDLESRVNSISALHDSLHDFKVGSDMEAAAYLASIAEHIFSAFAGRPGSPALALELERTTVHSEQILYLGLAVNELLTNAVKYGGKRVSLGLRRLPGGFVEATVADDGPGFSAPIPMRPGGLGLRLAGMLVEQMGGTLTADGSAGGLFRIRIPC